MLLLGDHLVTMGMCINPWVPMSVAVKVRSATPRVLGSQLPPPPPP